VKQMCSVLEGLDYNMFFKESSCSRYSVISDRSLKFSSSYLKSAKVMRAHQNISLEYRSISDLTEFRIKDKILKDNSLILEMSDTQNRTITISHFPGHYYPVEVPATYKFPESIFMNGMRLQKVFRNRLWFFNQRLPDMNDRQANKFLIDDVDTKLIISTEESNLGFLKNYIDENDDMQEQDYEELFEKETNTIKTDFENQLSTKTFFEIFRETATNLLESEGIDWAKEMNDDPEELVQFQEEDMIDQVEEIGTFIRALGVNEYKRNRRNFHTVTNLITNTTIVNRLLDLFFRNSDIQNERKENLPHYLKHVRLELEECSDNDDNRFYLSRLEVFIMKRLSVLTGRSKEDLDNLMKNLSDTRFHRLPRLDTFLTGNNSEHELVDTMFDNSDSDSENDS
jgi:hypothetical protein